MASTDTPGSRRSLPSRDPFLNEQSGFSADASEDWQRRRSGKELVRKAGKVGERLPASFDKNRNPSGRFVKGHSVRSGGAKKRLTYKQVWERALQDGGVPLMRRLAAQVLGLGTDHEHEIPADLETVEDFIIWTTARRAIYSLEAFREIYDRLDPKPQKIQLDATLSAKRAPISGSTNAAEAETALAYYTEIHEPSEDEPEEDEPEDDLSFLE